MMASYEGADILALEAAEALAAGMSYGKWKAMGGKVEMVGERPLPLGCKACKQCGKPFKPKKGTSQHYCDDACRYEAQRERDREKYHARKLAISNE